MNNVSSEICHELLSIEWENILLKADGYFVIILAKTFFSLFNRYDSEVGFPFNLIINIFSITTTDSVILEIFNLNEKC